MEYRDYYKILGVNRGASLEEIRAVYKRLRKKYHPDVSKEPNAEERFKEVQEAWEVLSDPEKRKAYDTLGSNWKSGQEFHPPPGWQGFSGFQDAGGMGGESFDFSDFFSSLFGGKFHAGMGSHSGFDDFAVHDDLRASRQRDEHARIVISLEEAFSGGSQTVTLQDSHGQTHTLRITIPRGILPGQQLRLAGQGSASARGARSDLYLEIGLRPHPFFTLEGQDILLTVPVTPWEAALGAKIKVPTLSGRVEVKIAANSQSGQKLRLRGKGFPGKQKSGNQIITLRMVTPPANTAAAQSFYEKMAQELPFNPREF